MFNNIPKIYKFIAAIAIQILVIFTIILYKLLVFGSGTQILLQIVAADFSNTSKENLHFTYQISNVNYHSYNDYYLNSADFEGFSNNRMPPVQQNNSFKVGDIVYVPLSNSGTVWQAYGTVSKTLPTQGQFGGCRYGDFRCSNSYDSNSQLTFIKGKVVSVTKLDQKSSYTYGSEAYTLGINYGIEDLSVSKSVNKPQISGSSYARVKIDENGQAELKQIYINEKRWP